MFGHMEGLYGEQQVQHDIVSLLFSQRNHDLTIQEKSKHTKNGPVKEFIMIKFESHPLYNIEFKILIISKFNK
jgi:hypothetical protein